MLLGRFAKIENSCIVYIPCYQNQCILAQAPVETTAIAPVEVDTLSQDLRSNIPQHPPEGPNLWSTRYHRSGLNRNLEVNMKALPNDFSHGTLGSSRPTAVHQHEFG
jgi:hypothetical protein